MPTSIEQLRRIFVSALDFSSLDERNAYLDEVCGGDPTLRAEIESLLSAHEQSEDSLRPFVPNLLSASSSQPPILEKIGPYKIREQIGEGGFGVVYVADQMAPIQRRVALKVIKPGMDTKEVIARFEAERQALAMMDHPNIAKVFDAGTTDTGRPYFVMELIRGLPITTFCRERMLEFREELKLFVDVCRAVQHAHQKGIIHRDLKPSNILITLHDGVPVVKVIDFGVAKALSQKLGVHTVYTRHTQMIGTPVYMSPEQAEFSGLDIDTRSDVYSLGVLLYELLTGVTPFDQQELISKGFDEMRRIIREDDPPRPSHRLSTLDAKQQSTVQERRDIDLRQFSKTLRRELDWIVMKSLEKNRNRRYESASALAADVERYLNGEPVEACPPSAAYRVRKTIHRQKGLLMTVTLVVATALAGMFASLSYARKLRISERAAIAAQQEAEDHATEAAENARAAKEAEERSRTLLYASDIKLVSDAIANRDVPRAAELLSRHIPKPRERDLRGFEWHYFQKQVGRSEIAALEQGGWVDDVEVSPSGKWLATTAAKGTVRLYETRNWRIEKSFTTPSDSIHGYAWSPDGQYLAAASDDGYLRVWNVASDTPVFEILAHEGGANDVVYSPDGQSLYSCGYDNLAKRWNAKTGEVEAVFQGHRNVVRRIALSPDGTRLATASQDDHFAIWESHSGRQLHKIKPSPGWCVCLRFSPDGQWLATGNTAGIIGFTAVESGEYRVFSQEADGIEALTFLQDGQWLATADRGGAIQVFRTPRKIQDIDGRSAEVPMRWMAHEGRALSLAVTADSRSLISGGRDGYVRIWTPDPEALRWSISNDELPSVLPDEPRTCFAAGPGDVLFVGQRSISIWDLSERRLLDSFAKVDGFWRWVKCSDDGRFLAAVRRGQLALFDIAQKRAIREWPLNPELHPGRLAISPDGRWIAFSEQRKEDSFLLFDRDNPKTPRRYSAPLCDYVAFSPDGRWLGTSAGDDAEIHLRDLRQIDVPHLRMKHLSAVDGFGFSPEDNLLFSIGDDRFLKVWQVERGQEIHSIAAHRGRIQSAAFTPDGRTIASVGTNSNIKLWHTATGQPLGELIQKDALHHIRFSADGRKLIGVRDDWEIVIYDASPPRPSRLAPITAANESRPPSQDAYPARNNKKTDYEKGSP